MKDLPTVCVKLAHDDYLPSAVAARCKAAATKVGYSICQSPFYANFGELKTHFYATPGKGQCMILNHRPPEATKEMSIQEFEAMCLEIIKSKTNE